MFLIKIANAWLPPTYQTLTIYNYCCASGKDRMFSAANFLWSHKFMRIVSLAVRLPSQVDRLVALVHSSAGRLTSSQTTLVIVCSASWRNSVMSLVAWQKEATGADLPKLDGGGIYIMGWLEVTSINRNITFFWWLVLELPQFHYYIHYPMFLQFAEAEPMTTKIEKRW